MNAAKSLTRCPNAPDNLVLVLGGVVGLGPGPRPDGELRSEYGAAINSVYAAIKAYF